MEFFSFLYALIFLAMATVGYVFSEQIVRFRQFRWHAFFATLAFGFCSCVGSVAFVIGVWKTPLRWLLEGHFTTVLLVIVYLVSGMMGSWFTAWSIEKTIREFKSHRGKVPLQNLPEPKNDCARES